MSQNEQIDILPLEEGYTPTTDLSLYNSVFNSYYVGQDMLKPVFVDIPVLVTTNEMIIKDNTIFSQQVLPGYLLSINYKLQTAQIKIILRNVPNSLLIGTQIINQENMPDFLYKQVPLSSISLLYGFQKFVLYDPFIIQQLSQINDINVEDYQYLKNIIPTISKENFKELIIYSNYVDKICSLGQKDFYPDNGDIENLEPYHYRTSPKTANTHFYKYEKLETLLTKEMINNRQLLYTIPFKFQTSKSYWSTNILTYQQREKSDYEREQIKNKLQKSLALSQVYLQFKLTFSEYLESFLNALVYSILDGADCQSIILTLLDETDGIISQVISTEQVTHSLAAKIGQIPSYKKVNINIDQLTDEMLNIREELDLISGYTNDMHACMFAEEDFPLPRFMQQLLLIMTKILPIFTFLIAYQLYFEVLEEQLLRYSQPKTKSHFQKIPDDLQNQDQFITILQAFKLVQCTQSQSFLNTFSPLIELLRGFLQSSTQTPTNYSSDLLFTEFLNEIGTILTDQIPQQLQFFKIPLRFGLQIVSTSLHFQLECDPNRTIWYFEYIMNILFEIFSNQQYSYIKHMDFNEPYKTSEIQSFNVDSFITIDNLPGTYHDREFNFVDLQNFEHYIKSTLEVFSNDNNFLIQQKTDIVNRKCNFMQESILIFTNSLQKSFKIDQFMNNFMGWKQFNQTAQYIKQLVEIDALPKVGFIFNKQQLDKLIISNFDGKLSQLDLQAVKAILDKINGYRRLIKQISKIDLNCYFMTLDIQYSVDSLLQYLNTCFETIQNQVLLMIVEMSQKLANELNHIKNLLTIGMCSPDKFEIVQAILEKFQFSNLSTLLQDIFDATLFNINTFFTVFNPSQSEIDPYQKIIYSPIGACFQLAQIRKKAKFNIQMQSKQLTQILIQSYKFASSLAFNTQSYVKELFSLDYIALQDIIQNPVKFAQKYQILSQNIQIPKLEIQIDDEVLLLSFLQALSKSTLLDIRTDQYENKQLLKDYSLLVQLDEYDTQNLITLYDKFDYNNIPIGVVPPALDLRKLIGECKFLTKELISIMGFLNSFRDYLIKVDIDARNLLKVENMQVFTSPFSLNISISPVCEVFQGLHILQNFHTNYLEQPIQNYPSKFLLETIERICAAINIIRTRMDNGEFTLYKNLKDYFVQSNDLVSFTVNYEIWKDYLVFAEDYVLKFVPSISFVHLILQKSLNQKHYTTIQHFLQLKELDFSMPVSKILEKFEVDNISYDILLILWQNATINFTAACIQKQIFSLISQIIIESTFTNKIQPVSPPLVSLSRLKNQLFTQQSEILVNVNIVSYVVILPNYAETLCAESLSSISLILNNIGYTGKFQVPSTLTEFERLQFFVSNQLKLTKSNQLPTKFSKYKDQLQQWRFDQDIEQFARDLECLIQLIHMTVSCLKRIPTLLFDIQIAYFNATPIKDTSRLHQLEMNLMSHDVKIQAIQAVQIWQGILHDYFPNGMQIKILDLCLDMTFCEKITTLLQNCQNIHENLTFQSDKYIIQAYSAPFNKQNGQFTEEYALHHELCFSDSQVAKSVIPTLDGNLYPLGLLIPQCMQTKFLIFSMQNNPIKIIQSLQNEVFCGCSDIIFDKLTGKICGIQSYDEILTFKHHLDTPNSLIYVFDYITAYSGQEIKQKCKNSYDKFYLAIVRYNQLRQDQAPFYLHDITDQIKYQDLQPYFKTFEIFFKSSLFTEIIVSISTLISTSYQELYQKSITGQIFKEDFRYIYFLINDLMVAAALFPQKSDYWRKAIIAKLKEWQDIFQETINLFLSKQNVKIVTENLQFPYIFYDQKINNIVITDSRNSYYMQIGSHWLGRANIFDAYLKLSIKQQQILGDILLALSQKQTIFMVGSTEKKHSNSDQNMLILALSRMIFKRFITVVITQFTFAKNLKKISTCLAAGYIVQIIGLEYLPANLVLELVALSSSINNNKGFLPGLITARDIYYEMTDYQKHNKLNFKGIKTQVQLVNAEIQQVKDPGILIFFLPELITIETILDFTFTKAQQLSESELKMKSSFANKKQKENQQDSNIVENYEIIYQASQKAVKLSNVFSNSILISIESDSPLNIYTQVSPQHGRAFYDISIFLRQLSQQYINLTHNDISVIYNRVKDTSDNLAVSIITLDFILRQSICLANDSKINQQLPTLIASFVSGAFGLDKNNSSILFQLSKTFQLQIDAALCHIGIINKNSTQPSYKKFNFQRYYNEFLQRYTSQQFQHYVQLFSNLHSLPLQATFDILVASEFLKQIKPLLLVTIHYSYLRIFLSSYVALRNQQLHYVNNSEQLSSVLRDMANLEPNKPKPLIAISPSSKAELMELIDKLFGFYLAYPIIQDDYGVPYYQHDLKNVPNIILCLDLVLYNYLSEFEIMKIFTHRQLLIPNIEGAEGSRKTLLAGILVDSVTISNSSMNLQDLWMLNDNSLKFKTNSEGVLSLLKQYQSKMLLSKIKDNLTQQVTQRSMVLPTFINGIFTILFDQVTQLFNIGRSYEELLIIRGILYFFLIRFKFLTPLRRNTRNHFLELAMFEIDDFINSEPRRKEMISNMVTDQNVSMGNDEMTRRLAFLYSIIQNKQNQQMDQKDQKTETPMKKVDFSKIINDGLSINRMRVQDRVNPYIDMAGFVQDDMKKIEDRVKYLTQNGNVKLNQAIQMTLAEFSGQPPSSKGFGAMGSLNFELNPIFIEESFLQTESTKDAFVNLIYPIVSAVWNAASLYFLSITNSGKWSWFTSKNGMQKIISVKYDQFKQQLKDLDRISILTTQSMLGMSILLANDENFPDLNKKCVKEITLNMTIPIQKLNHGLQPDQVNQFIRSVFNPLQTHLPQYSQDSFVYLFYQGFLNNNKESKFYRQYQSSTIFQTYELGQGVLRNTTIKSTKQTYDHDVQNICNQTISFRQQKMVERDKLQKEERKHNTKEQESSLYDQLKQKDETATADHKKFINHKNTNPYDSDDDEPIANKSFENVQTTIQQSSESLEKIDVDLIVSNQMPSDILSIEQISENTLFFDHHRTALIVVLASCMLTPVTICLTGENQSGKSVLIDVAKLVVRDLSDSNLLLLSDFQTDNSIRNAIASRYQLRNYYFSSKNRYTNSNLEQVISLTHLTQNDRILDYQFNLAFPSFHVSASDFSEPEIGSQLVQILRDHMIQLDKSTRLDNQYQLFSGVVTLSDTSFIIECNSNSKLKTLAAVEIQIPPINENFIYDVLKQSNQAESEPWLRSFVHGVQLVRTSLKLEIQNNFAVINQIFNNQLLISTKSSHSGEKLIEKLSIYETNGAEIEDQQIVSPVTKIFKNQSDSELVRANIHSYFYALRKIDQVDQLQIEAISERLASLCLLGNLKSNAWQPKTKQQLAQKLFLQTPWSDSSILLEQNFSVYPAWEAFVISEAIQSAKRPGKYEIMDVQNQFSLGVQNRQSILLPNSLGSPLFQIPGLQIRELAVITNYYEMNSFLFFHFMEIFRLRGQGVEPFLYTKIIEIYYRTSLKRERNRSRIACLMQFGNRIRDKSVLSGILAEDDILSSKHYILAQGFQFAGYLTSEYKKEENSQIKALAVEEKRAMVSQNIFDEISKSQSTFGGFSLISGLVLKVLKVYVKLNNAGQQSYENFINSYHNIVGAELVNFQNKELSMKKFEKHDKSKSKIYTKEEIEQLFGAQQFKSLDKFGGNKKYLVDLKGIYLQVIGKTQQTSHFNKFELNLYQNIIKIQQLIDDSPQFNKSNSQFLIILVIIRMCVAASLGIKNDIVLPINLQNISASEASLGFNMTSKLGSFLPFKVVPSSRRIAQLPYSISSTQDLQNRIDQYQKVDTPTHSLSLLKQKSKLSNTFSSKSSVNVNKKTYSVQTRTTEVSTNYNVNYNKMQSQKEIYESFKEDFSDIILVLPTSISSFKSPSNTSIWTLLSRLIEPLSILPTIFDDEEIQSIIQLASFNFDIDAIMDRKLLSCLLSNNFQVILIDDSPLNFDIQKPVKIDDFGSIKSPILTLFSNLPQKYQEIVQQYQQQQQTNKTNQSDKMLKALAGANSRIQNQFDSYVKQKIEACKNNVFKVTSRDLLALFKLSNCENTNQNVFQQQQFALISTAVYQYLSLFSKQFNVSLSRFTQLAAEITNQVLQKLENQALQINLLKNLLKFYTLLAEPVKAPIKIVDVNSFTTDAIVQQVGQNLQNQLNLIKQKGQNLPNERQIQLQTAAGECVFLRNYLSSVLEILNLTMTNQEQILKSIHFNAICCAARLVFNEIDENKANHEIQSGSFGDVGFEVLNLIQESKTNSEVDIFNILLISIMRSHGIDCSLKQKEHENEDEMNYFLAQNSQVQGKDLFVFEIAEVLSLKWPIYQVLKNFNLSWKPNDPSYAEMNNIMLNFITGGRIFFTKNEIALPTAILITARDSSHDKVSNEQFVKDHLQQVTQIDIFDVLFENNLNLIIQCLESENNTILFTNVQNNTHGSAFHLLTSLLQFVHLSSFKSGVESEFLGRKFTAKRNSDQVPIIIGFSGDISKFIIEINMQTQSFIDSCCFILEGQDQNDTIEFKRKFIQQSIIENVFGEKYGIRTRNEEIKQCETNVKQLTEETTQLFNVYIRQHILSQIYSESELQSMKLDNHTIQRMLALTAQGEMMSKTLLYSSFIVNKNQNQKQLLDKMITLFKHFAGNLLHKQALQSSEEFTMDSAEPSKIKFLENYIILTKAQQLASELSYAIGCTGIWLKQFIQYHTPIQSSTENDSLQLLFELVKVEVKKYTQNLIITYQDLPRDKQSKSQQTLFLVDEFPLLFHVKNEYLTFKKYLISIFLPFLNRRIFTVFPHEYATAVWLCNSFLFLTLTNMITNSQNNEIQTGELESFIRIQQIMSKDTIRLITSYQLSQTFSSTSNFNLMKLYNESQLQNLFTIDNIKQIIPEICSISSQLQFAWLQLNIIARYSKQMQQSMPWFITNHASLVSLCQVENPFLSIIYYFTSKNMNLNLQNSPFFSSQLALIKEQKTKLIEVPPNFRAPDAIVFYLGFCIAVALKPESIIENIEILAHSMQNLFGLSPKQLQVQQQMNIETNSTAILTTSPNSMLIPREICESFIKPSYDNLLQVFNIPIQKQNKPYLSELTFSCYNLLALAYHDLIVFNQTKDLQQSPLSISIIYYDTQLQPDQFLAFCYQTIAKQYILKSEIFKPKTLSQDIIQRFSTVMHVNPHLDGETTLQSIIDIQKLKSSTLRYSLIYPIFVLIPSQFNATSLNNYSQQGEISQNFTKFNKKFSEMQNGSSLNYFYMQKPQSLKSAFLHVVTLAMIIFQQKLSSTLIKSIKLTSTVSLRGFSIFCLKNALLTIKITTECSDQSICGQISTIFSQLKPAQSSQKPPPHLAIASSDLQFFTQLPQISLDQIDQKRHETASNLAKKLLFTPQNLLPQLSISVAKTRGIDQKIKSQMNVKITDEDDEELDSDNVSESSRAQSVASSHRSAASELSDDEGEDFDDSMSMFSQKSSITSRSSVSTVSAVSTASSINSMSFNRFDNGNETDKVFEQNVYQNLLTTLSLQAGKLFKYTDSVLLEKSIEFLVTPKERKVKIKAEFVVDGGEHSEYSDKSEIANSIQFSVPKKFEIEDFNELINGLEELAQHPQQLQLPVATQIIRRVFSSQTLQNIISELKSTPIQSNPSPLKSLPSDFLTFISALANFKSLNNQSSHLLDPDIIQQNLLNIQVMMEHNLVLGQRSFGQFSSHWIVSAQTFAPQMGDIFMYLKMQNSTFSSASLSRQRVIISTEIPYKTPKILDDGSVDFGKPADLDPKNPPFYVVLRGFELVGIGYDTVKETVCDYTPETQQGYIQSFDLICCVCVVDSWQTGAFDEKLAPEDKFLRVCSSYVPVPMKVGGYVRPVVFLGNKTKVGSGEWVRRGGFFAVKGM